MAEAINDIRETINIPEGCRERFLPLQIPEGKVLRDHHIFMAGVSTLVPGYEVCRQCPGHHLVLYTLAGRGRLFAADCERELVEGDLLIASAASRYRYVVAEPEWRILWFHLRDRPLWTPLKGAGATVRRAYSADETAAAVQGYAAESLRQEPGAARLAQLFAEQIALYLRRELMGNDSARDRGTRQALHALWGYVDGHLDYPWTAAGLAARVHMSVPNFHRTVLRHSGCSPLQLVFRLRMQRAEQMLLHHTYPIKVLAGQLGYATPFAFSNAFKRHKGISPSEYRRLNAG